MARGRFKPGLPLSVSQLNEMNRVADSGQPRALGSSVDIAGGSSGMAIQPTATQVTLLRTLKVTGTVTGGYSFQEVYDPNADGTYTDAKGINSVSTNVILVARSGATLATNDIVVARLNPYNAYKWEAICVLSSGGGSLHTENSDGSDSGSSTNIHSDITTGFEKVKDSPSAGIDTYRLIAASDTQMGAVTTTTQRFEGDKTFNGSISRSDGSSGLSFPSIVADIINIPASPPIPASQLLINSPVGTNTIKFRAYNQSSNQITTSDFLMGTDPGFSTSVYIYGIATLDTTSGTKGSSSLSTSGTIGITNLPGGSIGFDADTATAGFGVGIAPASGSGSPWAIYGFGFSAGNPLIANLDFLCSEVTAWGAVRGGIQYLGADATVSGMVFKGGLYISGSLSPPPSPPPPPGSITRAMLADSSPLSVIGRSANSTGVPADISAGTDGYVLARSGTTLAFGQVQTAGIAASAVTTTEIAGDAVTNAKLANVATATFKGRTTAGTGDPEDLTGAQATALLSVFGGSGLSHSKGLVPDPGSTPGSTKFLREDSTWSTITMTLSDGDYGDVVVSGTGTVFTIDNDVVTYAKMQNVANNQRILGRTSGAAGDVEELTILQAMNWITGSAAGAMLYYSSNWVTLTAPTTGNGQALRWDNVNGRPSWANAKYSRTVLGATFNGTGATGVYQATGLTITIPETGDYEINVTLRTLMADTTAAGAFALTRLALNGTAITNTEMISSYNAGMGIVYDTVSQVYRASFASGDVVSVQLAATYTGTPSASRGLYSDGNGRSSIAYKAI